MFLPLSPKSYKAFTLSSQQPSNVLYSFLSLRLYPILHLSPHPSPLYLRLLLFLALTPTFSSSLSFVCTSSLRLVSHLQLLLPDPWQDLQPDGAVELWFWCFSLPVWCSTFYTPLLLPLCTHSPVPPYSISSGGEMTYSHHTSSISLPRSSPRDR